LCLTSIDVDVTSIIQVAGLQLPFIFGTPGIFYQGRQGKLNLVEPLNTWHEFCMATWFFSENTKIYT